MPAKNDVSLNQVMGNNPTTNTTRIDLTKSNKPEETSKTNENTTRRQVRPVITGHTDLSKLESVDPSKILPKREPTMSEEDLELFSDLDLAIEREKKSIEERIDAIIDAQDREMEEAEEANEDNYFEDEDSYDPRSNINRAQEPTDMIDDDDIFDDDISGFADPEVYENNPINVNIEKEDYLDDENDELVETVHTNPPITEVRKYPHSLDPQIHEDLKNDLKATTITEEPDEVVNVTSNDEFNLLKDLDLIEEEEIEPAAEGSDEEDEKILESVKAQIKERIDPIRKSIDISKFTISKKAVSAQKVMKLAVRSHQTVADWMLYSAKRPISVTGLSGPEILKLNPDNSSRNRLNTFKDMYHIIYDHIVDGNKPEFETWLKQTNFIDLQHIYFALYMATFGNSNFVNYECPKCKKVFIKDIKIEDMIEYADDETRNKVRQILRMDTTSPKKDEYNVDIVQVSNNYAFALKTPSIWNVIIETASLPDKFLDKYADLIDVVSYIDSIYIIDEVNSTLIPIDYKIDPNDQAKTSSRRIQAFYNVIRTLSSEDYYHLRNTIMDYDKDSSSVSYLLPAATCPDCAEEIPANRNITSEQLVFTRHQLAAIANM